MRKSSPAWVGDPVAIFWLATGFAFVLRLWYVLQMSDPVVNPTFSLPVGDPAVHHRWAQQLLTGAWPGPTPFFRAPLYPYFLGALYAVFGSQNPLPVQIAHAFVSALAAGFAALSAGRLWDHRAAWAAGGLMAVLWPSIFFAGELLAVTLSVTLNLALLWLILGVHSSRRLLAIGVVWGLSALARPTVLVLGPAIVWYLWQHGDWGRRHRPFGWLWLAVGVLLTIGPVTMRNFVNGGEPVLIAASGGVNFYIGNNPHADGRVAFLPGAPASWQGELSDAVTLAAAETGRALTAQQTDRYFWQKGLHFWRSEPQSALRLLGRKIWLVVADGERSNNKNLAFWRARSPLLKWPVWPGWGFVLALAVLGLQRTDLAGRQRWVFLGIITLYTAALLLFFINARFRLPVLAWLVVPAGGGMAVLWQGLRAGQWPLTSRRAFMIAALVGALSFVPDVLTYHQDPETDFESWRSLGNSYLSLGDQRNAIDAWEKALRIDDRLQLSAHRWTLPQVYQPLSQLYLQHGRPDLALATHQRWCKRLPESDAAVMGLANLLMQMGRPTEARSRLGALLSASPENHEARLGYAWALLQTAPADSALVQFQRVIANVENPSAQLGAARCMVSLGRTGEAEALLRSLLKDHPEFDLAREDLARLR